MSKTLEEMLEKLTPEELEEVEQEYQKVKAEYMALQDLRKAMNFTQQQMASELETEQGNVSKLEKRTDLMLSTLRRYIEAMGGNLKLIAEFPERPPVEVIGFGNEFEPRI